MASDAWFVFHRRNIILYFEKKKAQFPNVLSYFFCKILMTSKISAWSDSIVGAFISAHFETCSCRLGSSMALGSWVCILYKCAISVFKGRFTHNLNIRETHSHTYSHQTIICPESLDKIFKQSDIEF